MKKILLLALAPFFAASVLAQSLPNGSFEAWGPSSNPFLPPGSQDPLFWQALNVGNVVKSTSGSQQGAAHLRLSEGNFLGQIVPGVLFNYYATNQRFAYLNGYFRKPQGTDTLTIGLSYSRTGGSFDSADAVAGGAQKTNRTAATWTPFYIGLYVAQPNATVDSGAAVILVEGAGQGYEIDGLIESNTPIGQPLGRDLLSTKALFPQNGKAGMSLYPNPAVSQTTLTLGFGNVMPGRAQVAIYSLTGARMASYAAPIDGDLKTEVALPNLPTGLYVVVAQTGSQVVAQRLSVR